MAGWRGCAGTAATWRSGAAISGRSKDASSGAELKPVSLRTRLLCALLGVGLLALLATGWQADQRAEVSLRRTAINQLTSIRAERKRQIEAYFAGVRRDVLTLAESRDVIAGWRNSGRRIEASRRRWPVGLTRCGPAIAPKSLGTTARRACRTCGRSSRTLARSERGTMCRRTL